MFFNAATALSVIGALSALNAIEASSNQGNYNSNSKSCDKNYFWYDRLSCCLKSGGETTTPPSGSSCPSNFYWHTSEKCCVPKSSDTTQQIPSTCPSGSSWNTVSWCCKSDNKPSSTSCGSGFWWGALNICLSQGSSNENPPSGSSCPNNWSWLSSKSCCKPNEPTTSTSSPSCNNNWSWHPGKQCCVPGGNTPAPSNVPGTQSRKRHTVMHKRMSFCPTDYESCPILDASGRSTESECIDTRAELTSCGGCTSIGKGQDCSAIPYSKVSTCKAGQCVVEKCKPGFEVSASGDSCISQAHAML
ncbi:Protein priA [Ceratobasidium theobromae]|uniref:Protein priA n=1 Tax=Ceratobasidium theobromae TaxID=1582974 RepID=A0A5N5QVE1_9AGAM|nr:Protein priA [Ceratobasidium theobromae]